MSTVGLARLAHRIDLGGHLFLGEGEAQRGGRRRPSILASAFEALAGALYLELGFDATRTWLTASPRRRSRWTPRSPTLKSPKSRLQEYTQRQTGVAARVPRRRRDRARPREAVPGRGRRRRPGARRRAPARPDGSPRPAAGRAIEALRTEVRERCADEVGPAAAPDGVGRDRVHAGIAGRRRADGRDRAGPAPRPPAPGLQVVRGADDRRVRARDQRGRRARTARARATSRTPSLVARVSRAGRSAAASPRT